MNSFFENKLVLTLVFAIPFFLGGGVAYLKDQQGNTSIVPTIHSQEAQVFVAESHATSSSTLPKQSDIVATLSAKPTTLLFVGDVMLSRYIGDTLVREKNWNYFTESIKDFLAGADLTFANLENPVSIRGAKVGSIYSFRADPRALEGLVTGGVDVVSLANNHMWDYGGVALTDTLTHLKEKGIGAVGAGKNFTEAHAPLVRNVGDTKVAFLAYTDLLPKATGAPTSAPAVSLYNHEQMKKDVAHARTLSDLVIVSFHWGDEYVTTHNAHQENLAREIIDAGADLIVGHHPHVPQDIGEYKGKYIIYSLGNFIFDQNFSKDTSHGLAVKAIIEDKKITRFEEYEIGFTKNYQPYLKAKFPR